MSGNAPSKPCDFIAALKGSSRTTNDIEHPFHRENIILSLEKACGIKPEILL